MRNSTSSKKWLTPRIGWRLLVGLLAVAGTLQVQSLLADVTVIEKQENGRLLVVYQMSVSPAAESRPAFKYRLTIPPHRTIPGNAATHYLRSFGEGSLAYPTKAAEEKFGLEFYDWAGLETPLRQVPLEKLKEACQLFDGYVGSHIVRASQCRFCDWGLAEEELDGVEALGFLLPSVQNTRQISRVLVLRTRHAIAEGRFDDAIAEMRMNYQLGQNVANIKFLVCSLVGVAEVGMANGCMIDLISAKGSPNMYWALAELPRPIIDIRDSIRLEMSIGERLIPAFADVESATHSDPEWSRLYAEAFSQFWRMPLVLIGSGLDHELAKHPEFLPPKLLAESTALGLALLEYPKAKRTLIEAGMDRQRAEQMPVGQLMLIASKNAYRQLANDLEKVAYVPFSKAGEFSRRSEAQLARWESSLNPGRLLAATLLPAMQQCRAAQMRVTRELNALQAIEAIRAHLAEHKRLPGTLAELRLPAPNNPSTDKTFVYRLEGDTAILDLPTSDGHPSVAVRFEITVADD